MAKKVLIIDDDQTGVTVMRSRLVKAGYEVLEAPNGAVGLKTAQAERPDLIVLDVEMPEMNGYSFLIEFRKTPSGPVTPVIVSTSHEENKMIFMRHGIRDYMIKPINVDQLLGKVQEIIGQA